MCIYRYSIILGANTLVGKVFHVLLQASDFTIAQQDQVLPPPSFCVLILSPPLSTQTHLSLPALILLVGDLNDQR